MTQQGIAGMGVYLVEGVVEQDPMSDRFVLRTVDQAGKPFTFDVQAALGTFKGREIRVVLAPLATVEELERLVREQQAQGLQVESGEPPVVPQPQNGGDKPPEGRKIEITSAMSGGKGKLRS